LYSALSILAGGLLAGFLPKQAGTIIGAVILGLIGLFYIVKALKKGGSPPPPEELPPEPCEPGEPKPLFSLMIKPLGITMQILKNPDAGDMDSSGSIDPKEAFFMGLALSVDALGAGIGSSLMGIAAWYYPFVVGGLQLVFLCGGLLAGKYLKEKIPLREVSMSVLSGMILIVLSLFKLM
jgi:Predicted membrane protein